MYFGFTIECLCDAEAVLLSRNYSSPEENSLLDCEMGKNSAAARKRRSLNIMLRDRSAKNARLTDEEDIEDQNELNDNADALSSPTSSGADPMVCDPRFVEPMFVQVCILCTCDMYL